MEAKLFGATFPIITKRVGKGGQTSGKEVKRINQLLRMVGYLKSNPDHDSSWTNASIKALGNFYDKRCSIMIANDYIDPNDSQDSLCALALEAGVLIPLTNGLRSASAITKLFDTCISKGYKYGWVEKNGTVWHGGTHTIWGFSNRPGYAISTIQGKFFDPINPITLNCTSFSNLMISAWMGTTAHCGGYDASQMVGGDIALGRRYNMQPVNKGNVKDGYCDTAQMVLDVAEKDRLYHFAVCMNQTYMKHDMVYLNGIVYECNKVVPWIYATPVERRFKKMLKSERARLMGPSPF